jgi:cell division protein FtsB
VCEALSRSEGEWRELPPMLRPTRLLAIGGLALLGFLYWKPVHMYMKTQQELQQRQSEVSNLAAQRRQLEQQLATVGTGGALVREARLLGLVKPGERLFIVKGISSWRQLNR